MIIRRLSDGREYTESQLGELLRDEGQDPHNDCNWIFTTLCYIGGEHPYWYILFGESSLIKNAFVLDPSLYQVRDPQTIPVEDVGRMTSELYLLCVAESDNPVTEKFDSIASRYLHKQETIA